jgi:dethiobiotin synthetase
MAGTDTGVGKTVVAAALVRSLVTAGHRVAVMKPIAAGADITSEGPRNADALELIRASNVAAPYGIVNPYCLDLPASPHIAAAKAGIRVDLSHIENAYQQLASQADAVIVEGAGGWLAPVSDRETMADVAAALGLPVILVVGLRLGCLNHALLTAQSIESRGLHFAGWIANHVQPRFDFSEENIATLNARLPGPQFDVVPFQAHPHAVAVTRIKEVLGL